MEPGGLCNARAMSLMDSPAFHRSHNSFLPAADNPPGRPSLATPAPPIRTTPKTLPCCTDRLNPPALSFSSGALLLGDRRGPGGQADYKKDDDVGEHGDDAAVGVAQSTKSRKDRAQLYLEGLKVGYYSDTRQNAGTRSPLGDEVVRQEAEQQSREELGDESVAQEQEKHQVEAAREREHHPRKRDQGHEDLGEPDDLLLGSPGSERLVDVLREHRRGDHEEHRARHQGREKAGGPDQADHPGTERLQGDPEQGEVGLRSFETGYLENGGETDKEREEHHQLIDRQVGGVAPDDARAAGRENRAEGVRPHIESQGGQQHRRDKPRNAQALGRQSEKTGLLGVYLLEHLPDAPVEGEGQVQSKEYDHHQHQDVFYRRSPRRAVDAADDHVYRDRDDPYNHCQRRGYGAVGRLRDDNPKPLKLHREVRHHRQHGDQRDNHTETGAPVLAHEKI